MYATQKRNKIIHYSFIACLFMATQMLLSGCGGSGSAQDRTASLTTPDTTSPVILSTTPLSTTTLVATNSAVTVNFSEAINPATVTTTTFNVSVSGVSGVSGEITFSSDNRSAVFTPTLSLTANTRYTINLSTNIKDLAGNNLVSDINRIFNTAAVADTSKPTFSSSTPTSGAGGVAASGSITATFTEAINPATLTSDTFALRTGAGAVKGTIAVSSDNLSAIFFPSTVLTNGTAYVVSLTTGITDMAGNALANAVDWSFTTAVVSPTIGKNYIINGNMGIFQRGTTAVTSSGSYGPADRWQTISNGGNTFSTTLGTFVSGDTLFDTGGAKHYVQIDVTPVGGTNNYTIVQHKIEDVRVLAGKTVTVSFWAKAASGTPSIGLEIEQIFAAGSTAIGVGQAQVLTTTWAKYEKTFNIPNINGKTIGEPNFTSLNFWLDAGASTNIRSGSIGQTAKTVSIAQIQLEVSPVATAFEYRSAGEELALCQRYYQQYTQPRLVGVVSSTANSVTRLGMTLPVPMRSTPLVVLGQHRITDGTNSASIKEVFYNTTSQASHNFSSTEKLEFDVVTEGGTLTPGQAAIVFQSGLTTTTVSAEF